MKQLTFAIICSLLLCLFSCGQKAEDMNKNEKKEVSAELQRLRKDIKKIIDKNKDDRTKDVNYGYVVTGISFDNKVVKVDYEVDQTLHIDSLIKNEDIYDEMFFYCLIKDFMAKNDFITKLIQAKVNILWTVSSTESKQTINHIITCGKLRKLATSNYPPEELAKIQLRSTTAVGNASLPIKRDNTTTSTRSVYDGKNLVYENRVTEDDIYDLSNPVVREKLLEIIKPSMIQNINTNKDVRASFEQLFDLCIKVDASIIYNYTGNKSGRRITVSFTPKEMKEIMNSGKTKK